MYRTVPGGKSYQPATSQILRDGGGAPPRRGWGHSSGEILGRQGRYHVAPWMRARGGIPSHGAFVFLSIPLATPTSFYLKANAVEASIAACCG